MKMNRLPSYVKSGDPIKASGYNDIVKYIRTTEENPVGTRSGPTKPKSQPFDLVSVFLDGSDVKIRIKSGTITKGSNSYFVYYDTGEGNYKPLITGNVPDIAVPSGNAEKWLGVDTKDFTLKWYDTDKYSNHVSYVGRFKFEYEGTALKSIKHTNLYSSSVDKGDTSFLITAWTDYNKATEASASAPTQCKLTISNGYVFGFDKRYESPAKIIKKRVKCGTTYLNDNNVLPINAENYDYVYLKITTNDKGIIQDDPEIIVTPDEQDSTHYLPTPNSRNGVYYYKLGQVFLKEFPTTGGKYFQFTVEQDHVGDIFWQPEEQGYNLNLTVHKYTTTTEAPYIEEVYPTDILYWRNGMFVGGKDEWASAPAVTNELPLVVKHVAQFTDV